MARKRMLSPEMFTSETIASLPIPTRWTWAGLLTYLDDYGRGRDNAALIKAAVWPLDDAYSTRKISADLDRLIAVDALCRYECCGTKQVHSPKWSVWQKPSHPTDSRQCPCPEHEEGHAKDSRTAPEVLAKDSRAVLPNVVKGSSTQCKSGGDESVLTTLDGSRLLDGYVRRHGALPRDVKRKLGEQIDTLIADGIGRKQICGALDEWARRPDAAPGLLPHLVPRQQPELDPSKAWIREVGG